MRRIGWILLVVLLLVLLAGCGTATNQNQQVASVANPALTTTPNSPDSALLIPAQPTPTPSPTPKPTTIPHPVSTRPPAPPSGSGGGSNSGGGGDGSPTPTPPPAPSGASQLEQQLFALINSDRAAQGLYPYVLNSTLSGGARQHSVVMSGSCGMNHQCPGEPDSCTRETNEGISWTSCGENIGYTGPNPTDWAGVQGIEQDMLNEQPPNDGHRLNLLSSSYHRVGVGIIIDSKGLVWITEDFAS
jgi:uncharacterized protein YkwD